MLSDMSTDVLSRMGLYKYKGNKNDQEVYLLSEISMETLESPSRFLPQVPPSEDKAGDYKGEGLFWY